jgi:hypothetical protein
MRGTLIDARTGAAVMFATLLISMAAGCGVPLGGAAENEGGPLAAAPRDAFFEALSARCGDEYPGRAIIAPASDNVFHPAYLRMRIDQCTAHTLRIAFLVDDDDSRTWVIERSDEGLLFTHEHVHDDGTLYDNSGWGGWATETGTALFQHFPDHRWDSDRVPETRRSVWRLRLDPDRGQFVYYLDRGVAPLYRLVFHMGQDQEVLDLSGAGESDT